MFEKVAEVMKNETGEIVKPETRLRELVTDSLEMASMILELEDVLGVEIPDEDACRLFTVQDVLNYAESH